MILNIMHHVQDCNRVLEVRRGLVQTLELCSCGKEKQETKQTNKRVQYWYFKGELSNLSFFV